MNKYIELHGKKYELVTNYKENEKLRNSFNKLTRNTFGFDFQQWYEAGYWGDGYRPYSLLDGDTIVANVSASIMKFKIFDEEKIYIQLGTVMTHKEYRGKGLSRFLIESVLGEWKDKCNSIYLFANDSVLDFYPKFGFEKAFEYQYSIKNIWGICHSNVRRLDMDNEGDRNLFYNMIVKTVEYSKISALENESLVMFYCTSFLKDSLYYIEKYDAIIVVEYDGNIMRLLDVYSYDKINLQDIISLLVNLKIEKVVLGFTPSSYDNCDISEFNEDDTTLFIIKDKENPFKENKLMFPVLSHT